MQLDHVDCGLIARCETNLIKSPFDLARTWLTVRPDVPIILTSGYVRQEDQEEARRVGISEVVLKPNTIQELGRALDRTLKRSS